MPRINLVIDEDLERKLRIAIIERKGGRKGDLSIAINEAIQLWLDLDILRSLYDQANDLGLLFSEREKAASMLANKGRRTNTRLTQWLLSKTAENEQLLASERENARRLLEEIL